MFKTVLATLLLASLALNWWQRVTAVQIITLQDTAIKADKAYWEKIKTTPVLVWKVRESGDLFVGVPYLEQPLRYKSVCMPEMKL